jgi:hypothetical protein
MYFIVECLVKVYAIFFIMYLISHWLALKELCISAIKRHESPGMAAQQFTQELGSFVSVAMISSLDNMIEGARLAIHVFNQAVVWFKAQIKYETLVDEPHRERQPAFPPIDPRKEY